MPDTHLPAEKLPATVLRFNLRSLFLMTGAVACSLSVLMAMSGTLVGDRSKDIFLLWWVTCGASVLLSLYFLCRRRRSTELHAGPTLVRCHTSERFKRAGPLVAILCFLPHVIIGGWNVARQPEVSLSSFGLAWQILCVGILSVIATWQFTQIWWSISQNCLELCSEGTIIGGLSYRPWSDIRKWYWGVQTPNLVIMVNDATMSFRVNADQRERVAELFTANVGPSGD